MSSRRETGRRYYLGVDGGGTKTVAVVTDEAFRVIARGTDGPSNFLRVGLTAATAAVDSAIRACLAEASLDPSEIDAAGIALAGVDHTALRGKMHHALSSRLPLKSFVLIGDARAAAAGAIDLKPGVVIIAGTGSIAFGIDKDGKTARSGGWGPVMGDEGSGYDIARHALAAVANAVDGRSANTSMTPSICARFGVHSPDELPGVVYDPSRTSQSDIASLAEIVVTEAKAGDAVALDILAQAGRDLGRAVIAVLRKLHMESDDITVSYVGGVFGAGNLVLGPLRRTVVAAAPRARFILPIFGPEVGAAKLAAAGAASQQRTIAS